MSSENGKGTSRFDSYYNGSLKGETPKIEGGTIYQKLEGMKFSSPSQHSSGSFKVGTLSAENFHASGSLKVTGDASSGTFRISGSAKVEGDLLSREVRTSGSFKVQGKIVCAS